MELCQDKFQLLKTGSNSKIYRYGDKNSGLILKVVPAVCQKECKHIQNEYKILKKLNHENIVNVLKYKESVKLNDIFNVLVLEEASKGNLLDFYKRNRPTLPYIKTIFTKICNGVGYLHCNQIAHRDLKLQNILVFQSQGLIKIKIADFGFASKVLNGDKIKTFNCFKGTKKGYMAPEIHECLKNPSLAYEARISDCFALGVILFCLVMGKLPFEYATKQNKLYSLISQKNFEYFWSFHQKQLQALELKKFSMVEEFKKLFQNMIAEKTEERYTIDRILDDPWLKNGLVNLIELFDNENGNIRNLIKE